MMTRRLWFEERGGIACGSAMLWGRRVAMRCVMAMAVAVAVAVAMVSSGVAYAQKELPKQPSAPPDHHGVNMIGKRLGRANVATGRGVTVGHVEGSARSYLPDLSSPDFAKVKVLPRSGKSSNNGHATSTARSVYGKGRIASGVTDLIAYSSRGWIGGDYLNAGTAKPPLINNVRVFNHSWIGGGSAQSRQTQDVLRRIDYQIDTNNVSMVMGVNNGRGTPVPALLGSAYNGIAVGVSSGKSSGGYTRVETEGRCKPDIVAVRGQTSFSTPIVTAIMARLIEASDNGAEPRRSANSEVLKALLMAGASKPGSWKPAPGKPLDERLGVGVARFDNAYEILTAGSVSPGRIDQRYGWDFRELEGESSAVYRFDTALKLRDISIMLVWNRRIDGRVGRNLLSGEERWSNLPRLCNFDLQLVRIDASGEERIIAESVSKIDNVEHVYFKALPSGRYEMRVVRPSGGRDAHRGEAWDYAFAFRMDHRRTIVKANGGGGQTEAVSSASGSASKNGAAVDRNDGDREFVPIRDKGTATFDLSGIIDASDIDKLEKSEKSE